MARKVASGVNKKKMRRDKGSVRSGLDLKAESSVQNFSSGTTSRGFVHSAPLREFISNPAVKYMAGGIATAILSKLAVNMSEKYPEISRFLKENIDSFERRMGEYRPDADADRESRA